MAGRKGYSLWLMPEGELARRLNRIISRLGRQYSGPLFPPHITLLGQVQGAEKEAKAKTEAVAKGLRPFDVSFRALDYSEDFFRALFIRVDKTAAITEANTFARKNFDTVNERPYMPHLSLFYGKLPIEVKKTIMANVGNFMKDSFSVRSVHLFSTSGATEDWYQVASFSLK